MGKGKFPQYRFGYEQRPAERQSLPPTPGPSRRPATKLYREVQQPTDFNFAEPPTMKDDERERERASRLAELEKGKAKMKRDEEQSALGERRSRQAQQHADRQQQRGAHEGKLETDRELEARRMRQMHHWNSMIRQQRALAAHQATVQERHSGDDEQTQWSTLDGYPGVKVWDMHGLPKSHQPSTQSVDGPEPELLDADRQHQYSIDDDSDFQDWYLAPPSGTHQPASQLQRAFDDHSLLWDLDHTEDFDFHSDGHDDSDTSTICATPATNGDSMTWEDRMLQVFGRDDITREDFVAMCEALPAEPEASSSAKIPQTSGVVVSDAKLRQDLLDAGVKNVEEIIPMMANAQDGMWNYRSTAKPTSRLAGFVRESSVEPTGRRREEMDRVNDLLNPIRARLAPNEDVRQIRSRDLGFPRPSRGVIDRRTEPSSRYPRNQVSFMFGPKTSEESVTVFELERFLVDNNINDNITLVLQNYPWLPAWDNFAQRPIETIFSGDLCKALVEYHYDFGLDQRRSYWARKEEIVEELSKRMKDHVQSFPGIRTLTSRGGGVRGRRMITDLLTKAMKQPAGWFDGQTGHFEDEFDTCACDKCTWNSDGEVIYESDEELEAEEAKQSPDAEKEGRAGRAQPKVTWRP